MCQHGTPCTARTSMCFSHKAIVLRKCLSELWNEARRWNAECEYRLCPSVRHHHGLQTSNGLSVAFVALLLLFRQARKGALYILGIHPQDRSSCVAAVSLHPMARAFECELTNLLIH